MTAVIDLSGMRGVRVDPVNRTAHAEGGATWGDFNAATYPFGLAATGGIISTTGVGGLTLGGGIGYLCRPYGLSCDNLISADVVTADGNFLVASEQEHPDLFWALRGGGGNFGVVTSFQFALHPVKDVYAGPMFYELADAGDLLRFYREFIADAPEELAAFPAFQIAPVVAEIVGPMPYPLLNSAFDELVPPGLQHYWKASFVKELSDEIIDAHLAHGPNWVRDYYDATAPHSEEGGYVNFMASDDQNRIRANYGDNYDRLVAVKRRYDPGNLFHLNHNVTP
jgi:FAD/FMN-containing dehydrogenase